jgi:hypothetical protein
MHLVPDRASCALFVALQAAPAPADSQADPKPAVTNADADADDADAGDGAPLRFGARVQAGGAAWVGRTVQRFWPEEGGWWTAVITGFNPATKEHHLAYNKGTDAESFETGDLGELHDWELREGGDEAGGAPAGAVAAAPAEAGAPAAEGDPTPMAVDE